MTTLATISPAQSKSARDKFVSLYNSTENVNVPVTSAALSVVKLVKTCQEHPNAIAPSQEESNDGCLLVTLRETPSNWSHFPLVVEDVRVFYRVVPDSE